MTELLNMIAAYHYKVVQGLGNVLINKVLFQQNRAELGASYAPYKCFCDKNILFCIPRLVLANDVFSCRFSAHSSELPSWE